MAQALIFVGIFEGKENLNKKYDRKLIIFKIGRGI